MSKRKELERLWQFVEGNLKPDEVLLVDLYVRKLLQRQQIAELLHIDRSTFTYRLDRCIKKCRFEYLVTKLLPQIEQVLPEVYFKTLVLYLQTNSQNQVAFLLKVRQPAVSQRLSKAKEIIEGMKGRDCKEFVKLLGLRLGFWGWPNEKKMFSNARIVREE